MFRLAILTLILAAGTTATVSAQPIRFPPGPPVPAPQTPLDGQWFMSGDPFKPCFIQSVSVPGGVILILTNEKGQQSRGRFILGGRRIVADDWDGLTGDINRKGNAILWRNGTDWLR